MAASAALSYPNLSKGAQPDPVYWNVWAAAPAALVAELRFASSSLQQHRSCKGENGGALPAPDPGQCELAFRSERPPFFW